MINRQMLYIFPIRLKMLSLLVRCIYYYNIINRLKLYYTTLEMLIRIEIIPKVLGMGRVYGSS